MKSKVLLLCIMLCLAKLPLHAQINVSDSLALVDLYNSTDGPQWKHHNYWLTSKPVSNWQGVSVAAHRVTGLSLGYNKMKGPLPASIGNLDKLSGLTLTGNNLNGMLPSTMGNLVSLTDLKLSQNNFGGRVPGTLGNLQGLTTFDLGSNHFTSVSDSLGSLVNVEYFYLSFNKLTGPIPAWIGNFTKLNVLWLNNNTFTGPIPDFINTFTSLTYLQLNNNKLTGSLPLGIGNLKNLYNLTVSFNGLSGSLPAELATLPQLNQLYLDNNNFSGTLPTDWSGAKNLQNFQLHNNAFTGTLPVSLFRLSSLFAIDVSYNGLSGELPLSLGASLFFINISNNGITSSTNFKLQTVQPGSTFNFSSNNFTFNGLESVQQKIENPYYSPQAPLSVHKKTGGTLAVYAGGKLSNNTYTWRNLTTAASTVVQGDSTFHPTTSGQYTVSVTNSIATQLTLYADTVSYSASLSGKDLIVQASPNPVINRLTLSNLNGEEKASIIVTDGGGNLWLTATANGQKTYNLDVSSLKRGNYLVTVKSASSIQSVHFIKE